MWLDFICCHYNEGVRREMLTLSLSLIPIFKFCIFSFKLCHGSPLSHCCSCNNKAMSSCFGFCFCLCPIRIGFCYVLAYWLVCLRIPGVVEYYHTFVTIIPSLVLWPSFPSCWSIYLIILTWICPQLHCLHVF